MKMEEFFNLKYTYASRFHMYLISSHIISFDAETGICKLKGKLEANIYELGDLKMDCFLIFDYKGDIYITIGVNKYKQLYVIDLNSNNISHFCIEDWNPHTLLYRNANKNDMPKIEKWLNETKEMNRNFELEACFFEAL